MPIVEVELVVGPHDKVPDDIVQNLADKMGVVFKSAQGQTWVKLRHLPADCYAENGSAPDDIRPIFVKVLKGVTPVTADLEQEIRSLVEVVARLSGRPAENIHVLYEPAGAGRIALGGELVQG